jgi:ribosomal protein S18 acetylase RimI-like enzyme
MVIRPVELQDRDKIRKLIERRGTFNKKEVQVAIEVVDEALRHPGKGDYYVLCAVDSPDAIAGYICFGPIPMTDDCYDLYWIVVDKDFSGKGVGGRLLQSMEEFLIGQKARRIYVDTESGPAYDAARSFYKKSGFRVVCMLDDFYRKGADKVIFMKEV